MKQLNLYSRAGSAELHRISLKDYENNFQKFIDIAIVLFQPKGEILVSSWFSIHAIV